MIVIKGSIVVMGKIPNDATGDRDGHSEYIDGDEDLVFQQAAKGDEKVIFDHRLAIVRRGVAKNVP